MHIDTAFIPSIIAATSGIVTALITGLIGKRFANVKALQEKLKLAQSDIAYLLKVEKAHTEIHRINTGESNKLRVRRQVESEGEKWSGQFTPGQVRYSGRHESDFDWFGLFKDGKFFGFKRSAAPAPESVASQTTKTNHTEANT